MSKEQGDIAEISFILEAKKLGLTCLTPYSSVTPYDVIVDTGSRMVKVQVKSTSVPCSKTKPLNPKKFKVGISKGRYSKQSYSQSEVDIFAVYIIPEQKFFIIPFGAINSINIYLYLDRNDHVFSKYLENWDLLK